MTQRKYIKGYEGLYEASADGFIHILFKEWRSANGNRRICQPKILKSSFNKYGYLKVTLSNSGKTITRNVHRLIAEAFIPNPENKPCINHKDGDKTNNAVNNLEWCTYSENSKHAYNIGLKIGKSNMKGRFNELNGKSIPIKQLSKSGTLIKIWPSAQQVKRELGVNPGNLSSCANGKLKTAYGFKWSYN